ncbi:MAG: phage capsid protein [Candidatus Puniceispirillaceae bacterium]
MTTNASTNFITSFDTLVKKQYQGKMKLRGAVRVKTGVKGSTHEFPVINKGVATPRIPQTDVTPMNVGHGKATATLEDWNAADYSDVYDLSKLNFDERQELVDTATMAIGRRLDQLIIDALDAGANATQVSDDLGGTNTGLNIEKILRAKRLMDDQGVPNDGRRHMAVSAYAVEQGLQETELASADYNLLMPLMKGELTDFSGFKIHMIESRDEGGLTVSSNVRKNFAWHQDAVGLAVGLDLRTEVNYIPEKTSTLVNAIFSAGAVVIDNLGVYEVLTYEA